MAKLSQGDNNFLSMAIYQNINQILSKLRQETASEDLWEITTSARPYRRVMAEAGKKQRT